MPIFSPSEIQRRQDKISAAMSADCLVIPSFHNSYYASGFPMRQYGRYAVTVLFRDGDPALLVPEFEVEGAREHSPIADVRLYGDTGPPVDVVSRCIAKLLDERSATRIGLEAEGMPALMSTRLRELMPDAEFVDQTSCVNNVRLVSSEEELGYLRRAAGRPPTRDPASDFQPC